MRWVVFSSSPMAANGAAADSASAAGSAGAAYHAQNAHVYNMGHNEAASFRRKEKELLRSQKRKREREQKGDMKRLQGLVTPVMSQLWCNCGWPGPKHLPLCNV